MLESTGGFLALASFEAVVLVDGLWLLCVLVPD